MNFYVKILVLLFLNLTTKLCNVSSSSEKIAKLAAISRGPYVLKLYREIGNQGSPSENDLAKRNAPVREAICKVIICCGFFGSHQWRDMLEIDNTYHIRNDPRYSNMFEKMYRLDSSRNSYEYTNAYELREFTVIGPYRFREQTFLCPFVDWSIDDTRLSPYYISKEYNLAPLGQPYKPGRFVMGNFILGRFSKSPHHIVLAEEPALAYNESNFDVERYYLQIRRFAQRLSMEDQDIDPLCRLIKGTSDDPSNQHHRLCVAVSRSSYIKDNFQLPYPTLRPFPCSVKEVSFKTREDTEGATSEPYYERMTRCHTADFDPYIRETSLYISRAYKSGEVFVYRVDPSDEKIYLVNLSINVSIVDELNSFDFIEY